MTGRVFADCLQQHDEYSAERRRRNTPVTELDSLLERSEGDQHYAEGHRRTDEQYTVQAAGNYRRPCVLTVDSAQETA